MFLIIFLHQGFEDNFGAHTLFIQESENRQEDCDLELIKPVWSKEYGICASKANNKSFSLKIYKIDIYYVVILIVCECCDYINCLYD